MDVIIIESKAYQELMLKLDRIYEFFRKKEVQEDRDVWLDSKAVCERLDVSTRTLFRLRKERLIAYSNVRGHYRFKQSDVDKILNERRVVSHPETMDELRQIYKK
jgi:excisionase family DNA binding protein